MLRYSFFFLIIILFTFCGSKNSEYSFPNFLKKEKLFFVANVDSFCSFLQVSGLPQGFYSAQQRQMAVTDDSAALFIAGMSSLQGASIAFQEWISYSDSARSRKFIKRIGKKAVVFSTSKGDWVVFYFGTAVFGVYSRRNQAVGIAEKWAGSLKKEH